MTDQFPNSIQSAISHVCVCVCVCVCVYTIDKKNYKHETLSKGDG